MRFGVCAALSCLQIPGVLCVLAFALAVQPGMAGAASQAQPAPRLVSLNPSLTAIVLALGAGTQLVGVDDFSAKQQAQVSDLPRVGGLYSPSLEAVVGLQPDRVLLVPTVEQRDFIARLRGLGVGIEVFENIRFEQVLENIERLGGILARPEQAAARISQIRRMQAAVRKATAARRAPGAVIVLQRDPLFVVVPRPGKPSSGRPFRGTSPFARPTSTDAPTSRRSASSLSASLAKLT